MCLTLCSAPRDDDSKFHVRDTKARQILNYPPSKIDDIISHTIRYRSIYFHLQPRFVGRESYCTCELYSNG